jgi:hypothetical protein
MSEDSKLYASDAGLKAGYSSVVTGPEWVRRFNEKGLAGLEDQPRPGRNPTHGQECTANWSSGYSETEKPGLSIWAVDLGPFANYFS